jgi:hypothetical protein
MLPAAARPSPSPKSRNHWMVESRTAVLCGPWRRQRRIAKTTSSGGCRESDGLGGCRREAGRETHLEGARDLAPAKPCSTGRYLRDMSPAFRRVWDFLGTRLGPVASGPSVWDPCVHDFRGVSWVLVAFRGSIRLPTDRPQRGTAAWGSLSEIPARGVLMVPRGLIV